MRTELKHPIRVVARLTGLTPHVIRAWERRYHAVEPFRTSTNRRLYTQEDINRLRLMRLAVDGGRRISDVADLTLAELESIVDGDRAYAGADSTSTDTAQSDSADYLDQSLKAVQRLDKNGLERTLKEAAISIGNHRLRKEVIVPLMHAVGDRWRDGSLRIIHEHLVSAMVRSMLAALSNGVGLSQDASKMVLTTPAGEHHELGALLAASAANDIGWDVIYLGPNLPADEIVLAAREFNAKAVGISIVCSTPGHVIAKELARLKEALHPEVSLIVGGRGAVHFTSHIDEIGAVYVEDLDGLQRELEKIEH
jgi:methylmalonyl-CoA mutase cobalamin-binding domain/chain